MKLYDPGHVAMRPTRVTIGLDTELVTEITDNDGAGIFVADDGSEAEVDSRKIVFRDNAVGDIVGNVIDVAAQE